MRITIGNPECWARALVLTTATLFGAAHAGEDYDPAKLQRTVLYSDLVVRGVITSLGSEQVPRDSLFAPVPTDRMFPVTVIEVRIQAVLKGSWNAPAIRAVLAGDPRIEGFLMGNTYDYFVGEEVVLCLHFDPRILGGAYRLWGDTESFVRRSGEWRVRGATGNVVPLASVIQGAGLATPGRMIDDADALVLGSIESVTQQEFDCGFDLPCIADYVSVRVGEAWKGASVGDVILVRAVRRGTNISWYAPVPRLSVGQTYLMFLKRDDVGFYPFLGFNGVLEVDGERLIMNGSVPYPISTSQMRTSIKKEIAR